MTVFEAYITNLGKYAEGHLVGETLKFPATTEEVQSLLKNIGVDGVRYEEFFITALDGDVMGLYDYLTEYENLDELNHLAHLISELDSDEIETLEAVLNKGDHTSSVADIINLVHNLDCYELHPGVTDDETLGRIYVEDMELLDVPDNVLPYFDFEAYGRDMRINEGGHFAPTGYLTRSGDFKEVYHGIEDATINAARTRSRKHKREISLEYLTDEKHYPLGTTDEYFQAPEPDEEYILTLCGDTVIFSSGLLAEALSRLDEREREMIYLSFFKRIPQHEIGRQYGRSRSTAGYHIRKALRQLQAEMEGMAYEK